MSGYQHLCPSHPIILKRTTYLAHDSCVWSHSSRPGPQVCCSFRVAARFCIQVLQESGFLLQNLPAKGLFSYDRHTQPPQKVQADVQALITTAQAVLQTMLKPSHAPCSPC